MPNYQNGKIYTIRSHKTTLIYVGSTTQELSARMSTHRANLKKFNNGKYHYVSSFEILKFDDAYIELIEFFSCENKEELAKREGHFIREMNCCNKRVAGRSKEEYYQENKDKIKQKVAEYYQANKDKINQKTAEYQEANKDVIKQKKTEYYEANKEIFKQKNSVYRDENKDIIKQHKDKFYQANKDEIKKKSAEYYQSNKDDINQKRRQKYLEKKQQLEITN